MKLIRYAYPHNQASRAFNRLFDFGASAGGFTSLLDDFIGSEATRCAPAADLFEDEQNYFARFELPGLSKDKIDLELEDSVLTVSTLESDDEDSKVSRSRYKRAISIPDGVDQAKLTASMKDGILTVTMPKAESAKPRSIQIQ